MTEINFESIGNLINSIKSLIRKNRDSISEEEIDLLKKCIKFLEAYQENISVGIDSVENVSKAFELLIKFFALAEKLTDFKDLF